MLKLLSRLSNRLKASQRPERLDAAKVYAKVMKQSRNPVFYAPGLVEDSTDGRMEWLTVHLSIILHALRSFGEDGSKLSQAIYDTMVDDFDIALREEGLSDSGVKRRIKPLAKMFLSRARVYGEALANADGTFENAVDKYIIREGNEKASDSLERYIENFAADAKMFTLDQVANASFEFPSATDKAL